ncbi:GNAT family N-acetyltransferase, partial [Streptomyces sp. NPDC059063]
MDDHMWPLYGLRLTTPRLELRLPDLTELADLAGVAADGVHAEGTMPFTVPWSAAPPAVRGRATFQHVLGTVANWRRDAWALSLAVWCEGVVVGRQDITANDFAVTREVETGSWLGLAHHGRGIGTEMRAAALHLAFAGLGARGARSAAMRDNAGSLRVSEKLGYRADGGETVAVRGEAVTLRRLYLDRAAWEAHRAVPVEVEGLEGCRGMFGGEGWILPQDPA